MPTKLLTTAALLLSTPTALPARLRQYGVRGPHSERSRAPNGQPASLVTRFIPSQGAGAGESGELSYYTTY
ncbi:hypothetical protein GCM10009744_40040 [Kribbella alba]|uniref:Uncharacterized protein n=1 Tax=Kribbella alba TaxID=190197 RepID=A0ABN2FG15_9ACTN